MTLKLQELSGGGLYLSIYH